jgi:hypothetical protein
MLAKMGDWLVIKRPATEQSDHRGLITEVRSSDGSPPYVVRWLDTGRVAMVFSRTRRSGRNRRRTESSGRTQSVPGRSRAGGHCAPNGQWIIQHCCAAGLAG